MAHLTRSIVACRPVGDGLRRARRGAADRCPRRQSVAADAAARPRQHDHRHRHAPHRPHGRRRPVPIDVIGGEALANTGQTETNKILNQLVPSFNFPQPSIADGTDALRPATLRGLSPDQTLVLVNGKRRHVSALLNINGTVGRGSAAVDLNLIPALAISGSKCCATAPRRNMARTRSPA